MAGNFLKSVLFRVLPDRLLNSVKKFHYARTPRNLSENEEVEFPVVRRLVQPGDHVIDIGANIGLYTKLLSSLVGPAGKVYSVEPVPPSFAILSYCVQKLGLTNVKPINCAVSDAPAKVVMEVPLYNTGGEDYYRAQIVNSSTTDSLRRFEVEARTFDSLFADKARITFIKMDVEGHELSCLKGAKAFLQQSKPAWLIEVAGNPDEQGSSGAEVFQSLRQLGYEAYWSDGSRIHRRTPGHQSVNYFFLQPHDRDRLIPYGLVADDAR